MQFNRWKCIRKINKDEASVQPLLVQFESFLNVISKINTNPKIKIL